MPNCRKIRSPTRARCGVPKLSKVIPPQGDDFALKDLARMLDAAENPVIICDRVARTPAGMTQLVELAETLQCAVVDNYGRMNFPSRHPLNQSFRRSIISQADVILAMEVNELWGSLSAFSDRIVRTSSPNTKKTAKIVTLGSRDLYMKSNYQDLGRYQEVDLTIAGDAEASLPSLIEQVKRLIDEPRKAAFEARGKKLAAAKLARRSTRLELIGYAIIRIPGWDAQSNHHGAACAAESLRSDQG